MRVLGFEPRTSDLSDLRSNQLSYTRKMRSAAKAGLSWRPTEQVQALLIPAFPNKLGVNEYYQKQAF